MPFSSVFWISQVLFGPSGKGRKRQKKGELGRFRPISRTGGQTPLKPPCVTPPFAALQFNSEVTGTDSVILSSLQFWIRHNYSYWLLLELITVTAIEIETESSFLHTIPTGKDICAFFCIRTWNTNSIHTYVNISEHLRFWIRYTYLAMLAVIYLVTDTNTHTWKMFLLNELEFNTHTYTVVTRAGVL